MKGGLRPIGSGRYACMLATPWGQELPAEVILATVGGWPDRPEARDPRWAAYRVGPIVLAIHLVGDLPSVRANEMFRDRCSAGVRLPHSPIPAEWN